MMRKIRSHHFGFGSSFLLMSRYMRIAGIMNEGIKIGSGIVNDQYPAT